MLADFAYTGFCDKLEFRCYFALPQSNQKAVKENPLTSKDNFVVFQSALPCLIPPTNMSQAYLLNGVTENVPDIDIRYFIRSYFACHGRSCTYTARNITSVALVRIFRDNKCFIWHHPRLRLGSRLSHWESCQLAD